MPSREAKMAAYAIRCIASGEIYVGATTNVEQRFLDHKKLLVAFSHSNKRLQALWNKHGEEGFRFEVLEVVKERSLLAERERHWVKQFENNISSAKHAGNYQWNKPRIASKNVTFRVKADDRAEIDKLMDKYGFTEMAPFIRFAIKQLKKDD